MNQVPLNPADRVILSLCDYTGEWPRPYLEAGYTVVQVDLQHGDDARLWPSAPSRTPRLPDQFVSVEQWIGRVHGVLAAPVCTTFAGSGARWPRSDEEMREGLALVDACFRLAHVLRPAWWALENPVGKLAKWLGPPRMTFQPCDYGDPYTKRTLLWGDFTVPEMTPVEPTEGSKLHRLGPSPERAALRSITPAGFARAFKEANP